MRWIEDNVYNPKLGFWSRANVGEVLPDPPSPLGWDMVFEGGTVLGWRDCMVNRLGIGDDEVHPTRPEVVGLFGGYAYLGISLLRVWAARTPGFTPELLDAAYFAGNPDIPPYVAEPWHQNPQTTQVMAGWLGWVMGDRNQYELEADRTAARQLRADRPDLSCLTDLELYERASALKPFIRALFDQHINQSAAASIAPGILGAVCAAIGNPTAAMRLLAGIGGVDSAEPALAMWDMSREVRASVALTHHFESGTDGLTDRLHANASAETSAFVARLEDLLAEFGSRGPNEWDIHSHTWETQPDLVLAAMDRMRHADDAAAPSGHQATAEAERLRVGAEIAAMLAGDPATQGQFLAALASACTFLAGRERSKTNIIRVVHEARMSLWEIGRRAVDRGELDAARDICMLFGDEVHALASGTLTGTRELASARRAHLEWLGTLEPPFLFDSSPPPNTTWPKRGRNRPPLASVGDVLGGLPGCPGVARGRARVVLHASDPSALEPGDVLIAPMTDPAWTPLFVPAAAVVVNVGAPLSHAIIVSRELGIPCVVSVHEASDRIPDGALVEVNGDTGTVTVLELP
ncbi:MAG TPA: PEP-utilizing enzyme [Ilumatobacteraceae bacterium]|nr:PEP-utilizing enzyme [Ilumatobacteraceae bacterium]